MKNYRLYIAVLCCLLSTAPLAAIKDTKHNLSVSGSGSIKASSESRICIFCHTPHNSSPSGALWNRSAPGFNYQPYSSSSAQASPGQPTGASLLCLSCHDGTIAIGKILTGSQITMSGTNTMPAGRSHLGTDLRNDHPISFVYSSSHANTGEFVQPGSLTGAVKLDKTGQLQCTSCHDPHNNSNGKFLVKSNLRGALCVTCHTKPGWSQSIHKNSTRQWDGSGTDPWPTTGLNNVADNACQNCHQPHSSGSTQRLLKSNVEEDNCLGCHNGHVANKNISAEFNKFSVHPVMDSSGVHDPAENTLVNSRHVECVDCHNPHAAGGSSSVASPLAGVRGITISGANITAINAEYQLCFRCHGNSNNKPAAPTQRQHNQTNVRLEFNTANPSYHPVAGSGRNANVPSLISPLNTNSTIKCTDCHSNNAGPGAGGNGPKGPHGSNNQHLLERRYVTQDPNAFSGADYALCFKCHSQTSITSNQSGFPHNIHTGYSAARMGGRINAPCNTCHDPHGVSNTQGNSTNNSKLINFNTSVVRPNSSGLLYYQSTGTFSGQCYLSCHNQNHNPCTYGPGGAGMGCMGGGGGGGM